MSDEKKTTSVVPAPGQMEQVAQTLLRLADSPEDVIYRSRGGHFDVPEELAVKYAAETAGELAARLVDVPAELVAPAAAEKKPRARARSKKPAAEKPAPVEKPARRQRASSAKNSTGSTRQRGARGKKNEGGEK